MKVLIAGGGSVGRFMAEQLADGGHSVTIIDNDRAVVAKYKEVDASHGVTWVMGDACEVGALGDTGVAEVDVVAAVTGDDEDNLVVSLLCKQEFGAPRVIARVNNPKNEWMFNEMWGVDVAVSTPHLLTGLVQEAVTVGTLVRLLSIKGGKVKLDEVTLSESSPAVNKEIGELHIPRDSSIVAVVREERVMVPREDSVLRAGDEVMVLVNEESEEDVRRILIGG
jgi:trk system potassium uptake protein TrkA